MNVFLTSIPGAKVSADCYDARIMNALENIIYPVVEVFQQTHKEFKKDPHTALFGFDAPLDSIALITFITGVEEQVNATTAKAIRIITPETLALEPSPFQTLGSLAAYLDKQLENNREEYAQHAG